MSNLDKKNQFAVDSDGHGLSPEVYVALKLPSVDDVKKNELLTLLRLSIPLNYEEKMRVIESLSTLSEFAVDQLIEVFATEKGTWSDFENRSEGDSNTAGCELLSNVIKKRISEWEDIKKTLSRKHCRGVLFFAVRPQN